MLAHFYHVYAGGEWRTPLIEHREALVASGFRHQMLWGVVGSTTEIDAATRAIDHPPIVMAFEGWEQVTLRAVREYAQTHDGAVLYAHTKGAHDTSDFRARWRRSMCRRVVARWRENLAMLDEHDAVGCHWLTAEQWPSYVTTPFFGGNYWMARCDYLRTLPECSTESRFDAERWIGLGNPKVFDLLPGWPGEELFACE